MKQLLTTIVFAIAVFAGFTARAEAVSRWQHQVYFNKTGKFSYCGTTTNKSNVDVLIGNRIFDTLDECLLSVEFSHFKKELNGKEYKTKYNKASTKKNPILENLGEKVISVESDPASDRRLRAYVKYFEAQTKTIVDRTKIFFAKLDNKKVVGLCYTERKLILIDKEFWNSKRSEYAKEGLIYHELGHCYFNKDHNKDMTKKFAGSKKSCPVSLMYPKVFPYDQAYRCFHLNRSYYFKELKSKPTNFSVMIRVMTWTEKGKWKEEAIYKDVAHNFEFSVRGQTCSLRKYKMKNDAKGYRRQFMKLSCTKDFINWNAIGHYAYMALDKNRYRQGFAHATQYSGDLRLWDDITEEEISVSLVIGLK